ncbi:MAG TPA: response regulator [Beijerinckiaceae bacterium]|nr:response regulator [Beijerinckiaceae bacterium]
MKSLEKLGAVADWAKNGEEALALAEASLSGERPAYSLVLMDIRMPGLDGMEATRRLRRLEATLGAPERLRVVALTANARRAASRGFRPPASTGSCRSLSTSRRSRACSSQANHRF